MIDKKLVLEEVERIMEKYNHVDAAQIAFNIFMNVMYQKSSTREKAEKGIDAIMADFKVGLAVVYDENGQRIDDTDTVH